MRKLFCLAIFLIGTSIIAQRNVKKESEALETPYTQEQAAILHSESLAIALDLGPGQKNRIKNHLIKSMSNPKNEYKNKIQNRGHRVSSTKIGKRDELLDNHKKEMKSILTDEQYRKWEKLKKPAVIYGDEEESTKETIVKN